MGRLSASILLIGLAAAAALGLASCGGGGADLLPGRTASEINSNLDKVRELSAEGECIGAEEAAQEINTQVDALGGVDKRLKEALGEGAERLAAVVSECEESEGEETEAIEPAEIPAPAERKEKEKKPKPAKEPAEKPPEATTPKEPPPQANGEGKGLENGDGEGPPAETPSGEEPPSGGVGPATPAEGE